MSQVKEFKKIARKVAGEQETHRINALRIDKQWEVPVKVSNELYILSLDNLILEKKDFDDEFIFHYANIHIDKYIGLQKITKKMKSFVASNFKFKRLVLTQSPSQKNRERCASLEKVLLFPKGYTNNDLMEILETRILTDESDNFKNKLRYVKMNLSKKAINKINKTIKNYILAEKNIITPGLGIHELYLKKK